MGSARGIVLFVSGAVIAAALAGCAQETPAVRRAQMRAAHMREPVDIWAAREQRRPEGLRNDADFIVRNEQMHAQRLHDNAADGAHMLRRDVRHFRDQIPEYGRYLGQKLRGRPENIEEMAIKMFI